MDIKKLTDKIDVVELISQRVDLKKAGTNYKGLCPFHNETTPSFVVSPKKGIFKCFGCNEAGDALSFHMKINKLSFMDAVKELAEKYKVDIGLDKFEKKDSNKYFDILKEASNFFKESIFSEKGKQALGYLKKRGFDEQAIFSYSLGYAPFEGLLSYLKGKSFDIKDIEKVGLVKQGKDTFKNRVMFTIFNYSGKPIGFGGRAIGNIQPKYINSQDSIVFKKGNNLYGLFNKSEVIEKKYLILVEGYTDVLALRKNSFNNAAASLGTALTSNQAKLIKKMVDNVVIMYDSDSAGQLATERAIYVLKKEGLNVKVCSLGEKDPDEFLKKNSVEDLKNRIKNSKESFDFLFKRFFSGDSVIEKKKLANKFKEFFTSLPSYLEQEIYLKKLSNIIEVPINSIKEFMKQEKKAEIKKKVLNSLEIETLSLILKDKSIIEELEEKTSFKRSKISFLIGAKNDIIEEMIKSFVEDKGISFDYLQEQANLINNISEFKEETLRDWAAKANKDDLEDIESLLGSSEDKSELIKMYYKKKREIE